MIRDAIKSALRQSGLFPIARTAYRRVNAEIRAERKRELSLYSEVLKQRSLCFDIGANLGQRSEVFLELGNRVLIVEPNPECMPTLDFLFSSKTDAEIVVAAVGSQEGSIQFYTHGTDSTGSALANWDASVYGRDRGQTVRTVPATTLDSLIKKYGRPDFTKIDVEGFEIEVLKGLSQPLPLLSFEFHSEDMTKTRSCLDILASFGKISARACSMGCEWLTDKTTEIDECLRAIESTRAKGDLFVWSQTGIPSQGNVGSVGAHIAEC
jgi:FkbM family methyltransferase